MSIRAGTKALAPCLATLLLAVLLPGAASAQTPTTAAAPANAAPALAAPKPSAAQLNQARKDVADGYKLLKAKKYEEALPKLEAAYAVEPKAGTLKTIAQCQLETRRLAAAYATYEKLLGVHAKQISKKEKGDAETALYGLKEQTGTLKLVVVPTGAPVTLDQKDVTAEQLAVPIRLDPGKHKVSARMVGFEPFESDIDVAEAKEAVVEVRLQPEIKTGRVRVAEPDGKPVHVLVDGKDVGAAPWEGDVEPGQHTIAVQGDKLTSEVKTIDVAVKSHAELAIAAVAVAPPPAPKARYAFTTTPLNAQLTINGQAMPTLSGELEPGMYQFVISAPGYQALAKQVTVTAAQPLAETVMLSPTEPEVPTVRIGALVGLVAFPRPLEAELMLKIKDTVGIGAQYSMIPTITFPGKDAQIKMSAIQAVLRWFPWSGAFYVGTGFGSQTFKATLDTPMTSTLGAGTLESTAGASTLFFSPQAGWLWTWSSGLALGLNFGLQIPISSPPGATSTFNGSPVPDSCAGVPAIVCDPSLVAKATSDKDTVNTVTNIIAKVPLPNMDLLKIGFFF